jgi:hypothetical protein
MELFIRIQDSQPFEHPIFGDNFREAFPHVDIENLTPEFARFERVPQPVVGIYEVYEGVTYEWVNGVVKDVHHVRFMTVEEKSQQIAEVMAAEHPDGWIFNEEQCCWIPPETDTTASGSAPNVIG